MTDSNNKYLIIDLEKCDQCEVCSVRCNIYHRPHEEDHGILGLREKATFMLICRQCNHASCVIACPFGVMLFDKEAKVPYKCELCDGDPACVSLCPTGAIVFIDQKPFASKAQALQMRAYSVLSKRNKSADVTSVHDGLEEADDGLD